ncbi:MAG: hypothetical protein RLW61_16005 [Gammaproteobacteria bacterium]
MSQLRFTPLLLLFAGAPCLAGDDQMPATPHQAEAVEDVERERAQRPETEDRMPVTEHQEESLREYEAADLNQDGNVTEEEYAEYMEQRAAREYSQTLAEPESPGVEASGPRDRAAAAGDKEPLAATDPTASE